jgi:hypothetical protein
VKNAAATGSVLSYARDEDGAGRVQNQVASASRDIWRPTARLVAANTRFIAFAARQRSPRSIKSKRYRRRPAPKLGPDSSRPFARGTAKRASTRPRRFLIFASLSIGFNCCRHCVQHFLLAGGAGELDALFGSLVDGRNAVAPYCTIDSVARPGSIERVCAVANAYKHAGPLRSKHPVASESDILAAGAGYGIDGNGIGKFGGVEVLVTERGGSVRKFLGDVPRLSSHGSRRKACQ